MELLTGSLGFSTGASSIDAYDNSVEEGNNSNGIVVISNYSDGNDGSIQLNENNNEHSNNHSTINSNLRDEKGSNSNEKTENPSKRQKKSNNNSGNVVVHSDDKKDKESALIPLEKQFEAFQWRKRGGDKKVRSPTGKGTISKQSFVCSSKHVTGCSALITKENGESGEVVRMTGYHNHPPPTKVRMARHIAAATKQMLASGEKAADIQKHWNNNNNNNNNNHSGDLKQNRLPTYSQIRNIKNYQKRSKLPSSDAIANVFRSYHQTFERYFLLSPTLRSVFISDGQIQLLQTEGNEIYIDETIDSDDMAFKLTTLLVRVGNVGVPAGWMIHNDRNEEDYCLFLQLVKQYTNNQFDPQIIFHSYEEEIINAAAIEYPTSMRTGTFYSFMRSIVNWLITHNGRPFVEDIGSHLRTLFNSSSKQDFEENISSFNAYWSIQFPSFSVWFSETWLKLFPPEIWARYCKPINSPTGESIVEGWQNRFNPLANSDRLDSLVTVLAEEWNYWSYVLSSPDLFAQKDKEIQTEFPRFMFNTPELHLEKERDLEEREKPMQQRFLFPPNPSNNLNIK
eukprot:TRINITY_DN2794_c0_g1_i1.p1 TRINITY_DN2794_c0_g1~~TRINITY_DN2794_c0_g1_i1.p1  ORF type:complete len:567 (+),score=201.38 TRINITY_DN2794_c0_g1_i1:217-1917(+)